jgi:hypothetical protein
MPLRKALRQPQRKLSAQTRRTLCKTCHNLDPRGHPSSEYSDLNAPLASLSLVLDATVLSKIKDTKEGGCRFCDVLVQALDVFFEDWRGTRQRVCIDIKEKGSIKVGIDGERWRRDLVEIYAGSGTYLLHHIRTATQIGKGI